MCAQQIAVKTNGLSLLAGVPNLGCELVVGERSSVDLSFYGGYKPWGTDIKLIGVQPEYFVSGNINGGAEINKQYIEKYRVKIRNL